MKIVVLAGGISPERDVSLSSGCLIANALMAAGHSVAFVDVYEGIRIDPNGSPDAALSEMFRAPKFGTKYTYEVPEGEPDLDALKVKNGGRKELVGPGILALCQEADITFIALHGAMGENGQLQALLDIYGIRYTGSGYAGCLLAMDKDITKRLLVQKGVATADWLLVDQTHDNAKGIAAGIGFPCVVKPRGCGSSVGVSIVYTEEGLRDALANAARYEDSILVEKMISGREFSVGILDGKVLPPIEIIPKTGFYDYKNKYQDGLTEEICPAALPLTETAELQSAALAVHRILLLGAYSRIDFIRDASGVFWCLEANTLPGMTPTSLLPQEAAAAGISYIGLCEKIAHLAFE